MDGYYLLRMCIQFLEQRRQPVIEFVNAVLVLNMNDIRTLRVRNDRFYIILVSVPAGDYLKSILPNPRRSLLSQDGDIWCTIKFPDGAN